MNYELFDIIKLIGSLALFIYGMKIMSEGMQRMAGQRMRQILGKMTSNRFYGVLSGFSITALIQSSSATTVMVVSFVNAGLITLTQSAGLMMGANIGTTVTAWLISILGFKVNIAELSLPVIALGVPMLFSSNSKWKFRGEAIIGFAILFMGLDALKNSVPDWNNNPEIFEILSGYTDMGICVGTGITIIIQSSSAAIALTLVMCYNGWIPFEIGAAMVLGENMGTTITAELASLATNVHSKRAARINSLFNIVGVSWMAFFAMPYYLKFIDYFMISANLGSPFESNSAIPIALSIFHTAFNVTNVLLLIGFVPKIVKLAEKTVRSKGDEDEAFHLEYIGTAITATAELSILEANKEIQKFGRITKRTFQFTAELVSQKKNKEFTRLLRKISKYEDNTDRMEIEIANYLTKVSQGELSEMSSLKIRGMLSMINDFERICDICYQMSKAIESQKDQDVYFTTDQMNNLKSIFDLVEEALENMIVNLNNEDEQVTIRKAGTLEIAINRMRDKLKSKHLSSIEKGDYNFESGINYNDLFSSCEKIGDHIFNVNEAIVGIK